MKGEVEKGHWHRNFAGGPMVVALAATVALRAPGWQDSRAVAAGDPIYVDADATGGNECTIWDEAFTDLQHGLDAALGGDVHALDEIWRRRRPSCGRTWRPVEMALID